MAAVLAASGCSETPLPEAGGESTQEGTASEAASPSPSLPPWDEPRPVAAAESAEYGAEASMVTIAPGSYDEEMLTEYGLVAGEEVALVTAHPHTGTYLRGAYLLEARSYEGGVELEHLTFSDPVGIDHWEAADLMTLRDGNGLFVNYSGITPPFTEPNGHGTLVTVRFEGAPERGLLTYGDIGPDPDRLTVAPVSICYDTTENSFSLDYASCR